MAGCTIPPPGATSLRVLFLIFDIFGFCCDGWLALDGAAFVAAGILGGSSFFTGTALIAEAFGFEVVRSFGAIVFFELSFFDTAVAAFEGFVATAALRDGAGFACFAAGFEALATDLITPRADAFVAEDFARLALGADRLAELDFFAVAIGYLDVLDSKLLCDAAVAASDDRTFKIDVSKQPCNRKNPRKFGYSKNYRNKGKIGQIQSI